MKYTYMNVFFTVAKLQNISNAAKELRVTQPAVSRIISAMEKEYKTKLFYRSKNGVTLTREGLNLYEMIENPFNELEKISNTLDDISSLKQSVVHIGATAVALFCYLFQRLETVKEKFPSVSFKIYTDSSAKLIKLVEKGTIDLAFITTPCKADEDLEIHDVSKLDICLIASNYYRDKLNEKISIKKLEKYPFVLLNKEMQFREHMNLFFFKYNAKISPIYELDSSALLVPMVENGEALTFIPRQMAEKSIREGRCFEVELLEEIPSRNISFVLKKTAIHSHVIHEIKQEIINNYK